MTEEVYQKRCYRCKEIKLFDNFNRNRRSKDGYAGVCRKCNKPRRTDTNCNMCGTGANVLARSIKKKPWRCRSCAMTEINSRPEVKAIRSTNAKALLARIGKIDRGNYKSPTGAKHPSWKGGFPDCVDCGKTLADRTNQRCRLCYAKSLVGENNPLWKPKQTCVDCGKELSQRRLARCVQCAGIVRRGENAANWKFDRPQCIDCGLEFADTSTKHKRCWNCHKENGVRRGEANHNWKGGIPANTDRRRCVAELRAWSIAVMRRDGFICQLCCIKTSRRLNAHHIKMFSTHPELRFDIDNGVTLCTDCHVNIIHRGNCCLEPLDFWKVKATADSQESLPMEMVGSLIFTAQH